MGLFELSPELRIGALSLGRLGTPARRPALSAFSWIFICLINTASVVGQCDTLEEN